MCETFLKVHKNNYLAFKNISEKYRNTDYLALCHILLSVTEIIHLLIQ